jgi:hypothetical protein
MQVFKLAAAHNIIDIDTAHFSGTQDAGIRKAALFFIDCLALVCHFSCLWFHPCFQKRYTLSK